MSATIRAGDFRACSACGSRNKAAHQYCVRCSAPLGAAASALPVAFAASATSPRLKRSLLAAGVMAAIAVGLFLVTVSRATREAGTISEDVRADSARTVAVNPPPAVTGWYPGANVPAASAEPVYAAPVPAQTWSSTSFPAARPNPYDVPADPGTSMVGIAPSAPRVRAAMARKRAFTDDDLVATRGGAWSTPTPAPDSDN